MTGLALFLPNWPASTFRAVFVVLLGSLTSLPHLSAQPPGSNWPAEKVEFFESRIRPVLIASCYGCHNQAETTDGGLALDSRQGIREGGDGGPVLIPGDVPASRLLAILRHEIEGLEMPSGGPRLDDHVIADFERWIADGAADPRDSPPDSAELSETLSWPATLDRRKSWWSFQPIRRPAVPRLLNEAADAAVTHPVDRFIRADLERLGLDAADTAEPNVLVRRLFFTLTGLPPTPEQAQVWVERIESRQGEARRLTVEQLIDELLDSMAFAERWARHWMDWIRYAESHGSEGDPPIDRAWLYRDYLIRAWRADVPYDRLLLEHLAGDLLDDPRVDEAAGINESVIGPAHLRMVFHGFAPTDALDERVRFTDDQINAISKAFLGLTVSCARCHHHKFDPISQEDYYALFGILASCRPGRAVIDLPERLQLHQEDLADLKQDIRAAITRHWEQETLVPERVRWRWQRQQEIWKAAPLAPASGLRPTAVPNPAIIQRWELSDPAQAKRWHAFGTGSVSRPRPPGDFSIPSEGETTIAAIYPAGVYSHLLSTKHAGRLMSPDIELKGESELWVRVIGDGGASLRYVVQHYPRSGTVYPVMTLKPQWQWQRFDLAYWAGDEVHIELATAADAPLLVSPGPRSWFGITAAVLTPKGSGPPAATTSPIEAIRSAIVGAPDETLGELELAYANQVRSAVNAWRDGSTTDAQAILLDELIRDGLMPTGLDDLPAVKPLVLRYRDLEQAIPIPTRVPGVDETVGRDWPLMIRGDHRQFGETVPRRFLEAIDPTPYADSQSGRASLAADLVRPDNPLTRRVIVNRLWHHLFGQGIVRTPDNLGRLGESPTHPELLDYLASRLVDEGWSLRQIIRLIVTSQTWQQSSQPSPLAREIDPDNRWLSHAHVRRLEAEAIRDNLLAVSGQLDDTPFGPPAAGDSGRRALYVAVRRNSLDPFLRVFDFPEPFSATGARASTNVPAQSLTMMNDPFVVSTARSWATRLLAEPGQHADDADRESAAAPSRPNAQPSNHGRIREMHWAAFARPASEAEVLSALDYLDETRRYRTKNRQTLHGLELANERDRQQIESLLAPVRQRLNRQFEATGDVDTEGSQTRSVRPLLAWPLPADPADEETMPAWELRNRAVVSAEGLKLDGGSYAVSLPVDQPLRAKTLEAWVQLDRLQQRGGGVISLQSRDGHRFDAIVFGEQQPGHWLAGSDHFARTRSFQGPAEREASDRPVHVAIAYHDDGRIVGYREGLPYGQAYRSGGVLEFSPGEAVVTLGLRHLPATGNRMISGTVVRARIYDRALNDDEVQASFHGVPRFLSESELVEHLEEPERLQVRDWYANIVARDAQRATVASVAASEDAAAEERELWSDLARALFLTQEFIYLR
ncbi:MAG: DUF1553 domain-containing protein [Planctomycetaceae bacterium]|nr:MAG: DUF1553 domain-containing protein [Planctomycetaceae bacterium]